MLIYPLLCTLLVAVAQARVLTDSQKASNDLRKAFAGSIGKKYESEAFNNWVDEFFDFFAERDYVDVEDYESVLRESSAHILHGAIEDSVNKEILGALQHQCSKMHWASNFRNYVEAFRNKDECIIKVGEKLSSEFRGIHDHGFTVKDRVASKLLCRTIPEVISCFEPLLEDLLACTDDLPVGINLFRELKKELVDHYCIRDGIILADVLRSTPDKCFRDGGQNFLNFLAPPFIKKISVVNKSEFPCAVAHYIGKMTSVILPMGCQGSTLGKMIKNHSLEFNLELGCHDMYLE